MFIKFVAAKTRVSPLKRQSIPRLELLSALILARLITTIRDSMQEEMTISASLCFMDSKVALYWIRGIEKLWKPSVQNRVVEIRTLIPIECWNYCPGIQKPADIPSRGATPLELSTNVPWCRGPSISAS